MDFMEKIMGMPWNEFTVIWKTSVELLFSQYLFLTVITYIIFVVILMITDAMDTLANMTFYFIIALFLLADPVVSIFKSLDAFLNGIGVQIPKFFM